MILARGQLALAAVCLLVGVCAYQHVSANQDDDIQTMIKSYTALAEAASQNRSLINPFKLIIRIISFLTYAPRFIFRFITTMLSVLILSLAGCHVIPEVNCDGFNVNEFIPEFMSSLREEFDVYLNMLDSAGDQQ